VISRRIARELTDKEFRNTYKRARVRTKLAYQIKALRKERDWLQGDLATAMDKPQSTVSRYEDLEYGKYTLESLFELSDAFDLGLIVEFVTYPEFLMRTSNLTEHNLKAASYSAAQLEFISRSHTQLAHVHDAITSPLVDNSWAASATQRSETVLASDLNEGSTSNYVAEISLRGANV
jgi:transcriptional regulator with XRE-family HTH domain